MKFGRFFNTGKGNIHIRVIVIGVPALILSLALFLIIGYYYHSFLINSEKLSIKRRLNPYCRDIAKDINSADVLLERLQSFTREYLQNGKEIPVHDFKTFAKGLFAGPTVIQNVSIAPNGIQQLVYPLENNRKVIGHNLFTDKRKEVRLDIRKAIATDSSTISGPYQLRQGGKGFVFRAPVSKHNNFWGLVNLVVDINKTINRVGLGKAFDTWLLFLADNKGEIFWKNSESPLPNNAVSVAINSKLTQFTLFTVPQAGWSENISERMFYFRLNGAIGVILLVIILFLLIDRNILQKARRKLQYQQAHNIFAQLMEMSPVGIITFAPNGYIEHSNKNARQLFGLTEDVITKRTYNDSAWNITDDKGNPVSDDNLPFMQVMKKKQNVFDVELAVDKSDGAKRFIVVNAAPVFGDSDDILYIVLTIQDITSRVLMQNALKESEHRYRHIFDNVPIGIFRTKSTGEAVTINPEMARILGFGSPEEAVNNFRDISRQLYVNPERREEFLSLLKEQGYVEDFEYKAKSRDGALMWLNMSARFSEKLKDGTFYIDGFTADITEKKQAEKNLSKELQEKEVILREVHHRVKNNLNLMVSLLNLQMHKTDHKEVITSLEESRNRIMSMALVHEKMYTTHLFSMVEIGSYINELLAELSSTYGSYRGIELETDLENATININQAVPCGLFLNELMTNIYKYAFPDSKEGTIWVSFKINEESYYELVIADNGVGFDAETHLENPETLGLQLIKSLVNQLDGTLKTYRKNGMEFHLEFPADTEA